MSAISVEEAEQLLHRHFAPWVLALHLQVRATTEASATLVMPCDAKLLRPGGIVSGQALMALADTAMVIALCSALGAFRPVFTVDMTTTFLRPATQTAIVAEATVLRLGRTMGFGQVRLLTDTQERQLVANVVGSYSIPPAS
jgi:uncharacterized protein (TIGR00369 family)